MMKLTGLLADPEYKPSNDNIIGAPVQGPHVWILIADKRVLRIYSKRGTHLALLGEAGDGESAGPARTHGPFTRVFSSCSRYIRHSLEPRLWNRDGHARHFARDIAAYLDKIISRKLFDRLVIIAPPRFLGLLRKEISASISPYVIAEINKDLTKMTEADLERELKKLLWF